MGNGIVVNASDYIVKCNIKENFFQTKIAQMKEETIEIEKRGRKKSQW